MAITVALFLELAAPKQRGRHGGGGGGGGLGRPSSLSGVAWQARVQGHQLAHREGQLGCCPFRIESRRIGASCWRRDRKRSIHFLRALYDIPRTREPLGEQPRAHHLIFHRKAFHSQKHNLSASAACQVGEHPFYAPHATIRSYLRIKSKRHTAPQRSLDVTRVTLPLRWCRLIHTKPAGTVRAFSMLELPWENMNSK